MQFDSYRQCDYSPMNTSINKNIVSLPSKTFSRGIDLYIIKIRSKLHLKKNPKLSVNLQYAKGALGQIVQTITLMFLKILKKKMIEYTEGFH